MYNRLILYPYNLGSQSARNLAGVFETRRVRPNGKYRYRRNHLVVNWGNGHIPQWGTVQALANMINKPQNVSITADKLRAFQRLNEGACRDFLVPWTTRREEAVAWLRNPVYAGLKNAVVCRKLTRAYSGRGIVFAENEEQVEPAPLYTRYKPKETEFRVHVSTRYGIIDAQEKRRRNDQELLDKYIRSYDNGWVFCREEVLLPEQVKEAAMLAVSSLGLDFGAVDIGYHSRHGVAIYEVNTAPGLEGQTLHNYVSMFKRYMLNG